MIERRVNSFEFYSAAPSIADRLFHAARRTGRLHWGDIEEVLLLTMDDGTETEAIMPIEEYRRLKRIATRIGLD